MPNDIYYPHHFKILEGYVENAKWNIAYYNKPHISEEDKIGCYFIYDTNEELVYIGKVIRIYFLDHVNLLLNE